MSRSFRFAIASAVLALGLSQAQAQYAWDIGVHIGGANYLGEMGGKDQPRRDFIWDMKLSQTRWAVGVFARRKINRLISINTGFMYLRLQGADVLTESYRPRRGRNLNFRNDVFEWYLRPEFTIYQDNDLGGHGRYRTDFRLFGYVGIGLFYHNPKGEFLGPDNTVVSNGEWVSLRPLTTELVDYSPIGICIPAGIGFHFTQGRRHRYGFDLGWRTTFTDYIDDVSTVYEDPAQMPGGVGGLADLMADQSMYAYAADPTLPAPENYGWWDDTPGPSKKPKNIRGDPTHNDSYLTMTFTYSYVLRGQSNFYRQRYNWIRGNKRVGRKSRAKF
ncbi:MAG: DUF6089 family protein [Flavobacteriales bacterium]